MMILTSGVTLFQQKYFLDRPNTISKSDHVSLIIADMYSPEHYDLIRDAGQCSDIYSDNLTAIIDDNTIGMDILDFFLGTVSKD